MSKGYIAHFYPESDASQRYKAGKILEVIGPVFTTYAEAARQINDELDDIVVQALPVSPYIIEVESHTNGYQISEVYELHFDDAGRESNPRRPSAKMTPVGELVGKGKNAVVDMADLRGIETGKRRQRSVSEAAQDYGSFMGRYAPKGVPASKIASAFRQRVTPKRVIEERRNLSEVRHEAVKKFSTAINRDLKTHGVTASMERSAAKIEATRDALKQGQITKAEAAGVLALESKKQRVLRILQDYCPKVSVSPDDATEAEEILTKTYDAVVEVLGGGSDGADAAAAVIEKVVENYTGEQVEVTRYGAETAAEPAEEVAPRRRGRPPRAVAEPPAEAEAPRRRGRPPRAAAEPPGGGREDRALSGKRFAAFDEARRIVGLPFREAERALESSSFTLEQLYDALEDRNFHSENLVLQSLAVPFRLMRAPLWKQATELVKAHHSEGHLSPALQQERNELYEKIQKYLNQKIEPIVGIDAPADTSREASVVVDAPPPPINPATAPEPVIVAAPSVDAGYDEDEDYGDSLPSARKHKRDVRINLVLPLDVVKQMDVMSPDFFTVSNAEDWLTEGFQAGTIRPGTTSDGAMWPYYTWKDILACDSNPGFELVFDGESPNSVRLSTAIEAAILLTGIKWYCELVDEYRRKEALALLAILVENEELHAAVLEEDAYLDLIQRDLMREADRLRMPESVYCETKNTTKPNEVKEYALFATYPGTIGDAVRSCNLSSPLFEYEAPPVELPPRIIPSEAPAPVFVPEPVRIAPPRVMPEPEPVRIAPPRVVAAPPRPSGPPSRALLDQIEDGRNRLRTAIEDVRELSQDKELPNPILRMFDEAERELRQAAYFHKDEQPAAKVAGMNELAARLEEAVTNFRNPRRVAPPSAPPRIVVTPPAPVPEPVIDEAELQEAAMERMSQRLASAEDSLLSRLQSERSRSSIEETPVNTPSRESRAPAARASRPAAPPAARASRPTPPPAPPAPSESELQEAALAQLQDRLSSAEDSLLAKLAALKR